MSFLPESSVLIAVVASYRIVVFIIKYRGKWEFVLLNFKSVSTGIYMGISLSNAETLGLKKEIL